MGLEVVEEDMANKEETTVAEAAIEVVGEAKEGVVGGAAVREDDFILQQKCKMAANDDGHRYI